MGVAVHGDRGSCVSLRLGPATYIFAVASGFGSIDGLPVARAALDRIRADCERRANTHRFRRALARQDGAMRELLSVLGRVNAELFGRSASHEDYVTAACSLTAVLLVGDRAHVAHVGSTAAYVVRSGYVATLTPDHGIGEDSAPRILARAFGTQPDLDAAVCGFTLGEGDVLMLADRRLRDPSKGGDDRVLVVRYARGEVPPAPKAVVPIGALHHAARVAALVAAFATLMCLR
jgi:serine/threonine protein phosphatase PrpC